MTDYGVHDRGIVVRFLAGQRFACHCVDNNSAGRPVGVGGSFPGRKVGGACRQALQPPAVSKVKRDGAVFLLTYIQPFLL